VDRVRDLRGLALVLAVAAAFSASAAASGPIILKNVDLTLQPSGAHIRLVASKTNLDARPNGRVALWLTLYTRHGIGYRKVKQLKVATGFKRSSRVVSLTAKQLKGAAYRNTAEVHLRWLVTPSIGKRTYSFVATPTRLAPQG
jgi:hypothetical protein